MSDGLAVAGVLALSALIMAANYDKALWDGVQGWGRPYWWLDYGHGFVRRGLVGSVFQALAGRLDEAKLGPPVHAIHGVAAAFIALATLFALGRALWTAKGSGHWALLAAAAVWSAASQFWPTLAYNEGYLDSLTLSCALAAVLCLRLRLGWFAAPFMVLGPLIHEYFVFLTPFILASARLDLKPQETDRTVHSMEAEHEPRPFPIQILVLGLLAFAAAAFVTFGADAAATRIDIEAMPLAPQDRAVLITTTLSQSVGKSLQDCTTLLFAHPTFTAKAFAFFLLPALISTAMTLFWAGPPRHALLWLRAAAGLFPVAALLLAWDLSRLLVMATPTAFLLLCFTVEDYRGTPKPRPQARRWLSAGAAIAVGAAALVYATAPLAYVYYLPAQAAVFPLRVWPGDGANTFGFDRLWLSPHVVPAEPLWGHR